MKNQEQKTTNQQEQNIFNVCDPKDTKRALQLGFNLSKLAIFVNSICANFTDQEKPNSLDINDRYIWLYVYEPTTGNYKDMQTKYNNCKGWAIPDGLKEKNNKKILSNLLDFATRGADFKKSNKPENGYFIKEIANNKPLTLLKAKNNDFVCFVVFANYGKINEIDINENKKEYDKNFFEISNNCWDAAKIRKESINIYAVYNKQMAQYKKTCELIAKKRAERTQNRYTTPKETKRYFYNNDSVFNDLLKTENCLHFYNFSYNSLSDSQYDTVEGGLIVKYEGVEFLRTDKDTTRKEVFNYCVDKSGFCVIFYREKLLKRLETLKAKRAKAREEQERKEWITSDKTELTNKVNNILQDLTLKILGRTSMAELLNDNQFNALKKYRELYKQFEKQLNFENYNNVSEWQKYFDRKMNDFNFYDRAIKKGVLERVACIHHYEKQPNGEYKNVSKDSYFSNPERYIQTF